jgi:hypothetical protein
MPSKYVAGVGSLVLAIDRQDIITTNSRIRDDQKNLKVWISRTDLFEPVIKITTIAGSTLTTAAAHKLRIGDVIKPRVTNSGFTAATNYYVLTVPTTTTFTVASTVTGTAAASFTTGSSLSINCDVNLLWDAEGLQATIPNLEPEKTHYFKYALVSALDTTIYSLSSQYSFIPKAAIVAGTSDYPPTPYGINITAGALSTIVVTLPSITKKFNATITSGSQIISLLTGSTNDVVEQQSLKLLNILTGTPALGSNTTILQKPLATPTASNPLTAGQLQLASNATGSGTAELLYSQSIDYNTSSYTVNTALYTNASSSHGSTVIYGKKLNSLSESITFTDVQTSIIGEFSDTLTFSFPAEPGTSYGLFFKYRNKAGNLSLVADGPYSITAGNGIQQLINMLAESITEGTLYKALQTRISKIDRSDDRPALEIEQLNNQYTVKIDDGGYISGFGLASTRSNDSTATSEFGVSADRFWVAQPAYVGASAPANPYTGRVWTDTNSANAINEGKIGGVKVYYNTYSPTIHNKITFPSDPTYEYWEIKTSQGIKNLTQTSDPTVSGNGYTYRTKWAPETSYALKDYLYDENSGDYYVCVKAYTPVVVTDLATKNASNIGNFTATGTFAVDKTIYITGIETVVTTANGGGNQPTTKLGGSYKSTGTFYYITQVSGSVFVLSLKKSGTPIVTAIKGLTKYYENGAWVTKRTASSLPFVVQSTPLYDTDGTTVKVPAGVYINDAFIQNASITNAKIADASIDSAKISELTASKIKGGTIDADLINAGALTVNKLDIQSMRGNVASTWTIASPSGGTSEVSRQVDLPPGNYEIILYANFAKDDAYNVFGTYTSTIQAEVASIAGSTVTAEGKWEKLEDKAELDIKLTNKVGTITTQPTINVTNGLGISISDSKTISISFDLSYDGGGGGGGGGGY